MVIFRLFNEIDEIVMLQFGDVEAALQTDRGKQLIKELLSEENRKALREWYKPRLRPMNSAAIEMKHRLEKELGEQL